MGKILEGIGVWAKYWKGLALNWKLKQNGKRIPTKLCYGAKYLAGQS